MTPRDPFAVARRGAGYALAAAGPVFVILVIEGASSRGILASDFRYALAAASRFVHRQPLYGSNAPLDYVYPPFYAELLTPFLLVPVEAATWIAAFGCAAIVVAGLLALGVRDVRVLGLALCSAPVIHGLQVANASFLVFGLIVLAWRVPRAGTGFAVAVKFIAWPLLVWEAMTRGVRAAAASALIAVALLLGSWTLVGFEGLLDYPSFVNEVGEGQGKFGYSVAGAFTGGRWIAVALTAAALVRCWSRSRSGDPAGGLAYAIAAMLTATPYVYDNYFVAVLIPLALRRPRLSAAWFLPLLLWINGGGQPPLSGRVAAWVLFGGMLVWLGEGAPRPRTVWTAGRKTVARASEG